MGLEPSDQSTVGNASVASTSATTSKTPRRYTKEFLLSFSELEICKKQPHGIDPLILRSNVIEVVNTETSSARGLVVRDRNSDISAGEPPKIPEWRRMPGQSWSENGPSRGNYDRNGRQNAGSHMRWDHRPGGNGRDRERLRNEKDTLEQDSGRRFHGNDHHSRQGMTSEHDGILGSGAGSRTMRPSGASTLAHPRQYDRHGASRLNHANDAYHSHRNSKFTHHPRSETTDSYNDETFGSEEVSSNEERIELEKKRRDNFELMRKEQQKLLEKQKQAHQNVPRTSQTLSNDVFGENEGAKSEDHPAILPLPEKRVSQSSKVTSSSTSTPATSRPLVPPGFSKVSSGRHVLKHKNLDSGTEVRSLMPADSHNDIKHEISLDGNESQMKEGHPVTLLSSAQKQEMQETIQDNSIAAMITGTQNRAVSVSEIENENWSPGLDNIIGFCGGGEADSRANDVKERAESLLDRFFGKNSSELDKMDISESDKVGNFEQNSKRTPKSSKFARWFHAQEESGNDKLDEGGSNMLSLFSNKDCSTNNIPLSKEKFDASDTLSSPLESIFSHHNSGRVIPMPVGPSLEDIEKGMKTSTEVNVHNETTSAQDLHNEDSNPSGVTANIDDSDFLNKKDHMLSSSSRLSGKFVTCEDLEQSIIAEASEHFNRLKIDSNEKHIDADAKTRESMEMNDGGSHNLLSLLQKGLKSNDSNPPELVVNNAGAAYQGRNMCNADTPVITDRSGEHTLEELFGKQFMNELRSADAPVSVKSTGTEKSSSQEAFVEDDALRLNPDLRQKSADFTDRKSRYAEHHTNIPDIGSLHSWGSDGSAVESMFPPNALVGAPHRPPLPSDSLGIPANGGMEHLLGMIPRQNSHVSQQLMGSMDTPFNAHSLPGINVRMPPAPQYFPFHHVPGHQQNNPMLHQQMNMPQVPQNQMNMPQVPQNQQVKPFDQGSSIELVHSIPDSWPEHSLGRSFPREPSGQMPFPLPNGQHGFPPHGFPPNPLMQPVSLPQRGPPMSSFPFPLEQMHHAPRGLQPTFMHIPGSFITDPPVSGMQNQPLHVQAGYNPVAAPPNQSMRPVYPPSRDFNISVDARQHPGAMGHDGARLDALFAKEAKRHLGGQGPINQFSNRNIGYG